VTKEAQRTLIGELGFKHLRCARPSKPEAVGLEVIRVVVLRVCQRKENRQYLLARITNQKGEALQRKATQNKGELKRKGHKRTLVYNRPIRIELLAVVHGYEAALRALDRQTYPTCDNALEGGDKLAEEKNVSYNQYITRSENAIGAK
jgi:hypothetical protein